MARVGGILGGGSELQIEALGCFFEAVGLAFQIIDDVLNLRGFERDLKERGEDIRHGKLTLPVVKALGCLPLERRTWLWSVLLLQADRFGRRRRDRSSSSSRWARSMPARVSLTKQVEQRVGATRSVARRLAGQADIPSVLVVRARPALLIDATLTDAPTRTRGRRTTRGINQWTGKNAQLGCRGEMKQAIGRWAWASDRCGGGRHGRLRRAERGRRPRLASLQLALASGLRVLGRQPGLWRPAMPERTERGCLSVFQLRRLAVR